MASPEAMEAQLAALTARVEDVEAALAIQRLKARYAELVDQRYHRGSVAAAEKVRAVADEIATLFTPDGVWDGGKALGVSKGRDEIAARMREPTLLFSWHYFLKPQIEVHGDRATAKWDILSPCTTKDGRPHWMAGTEDDAYARVDGTWLHTSMRLTTVFLAPHETGWEKVFV